MRPNTILAKWQKGETVINGWLHIPSGWSTEVMAHAGYDALTIDMQHGQLDFGDALEMLRAISTTSVMPLARVPWNEPGITMRLLDAGAYGIICPMVNNREECERFVGACRYHPEGYRSRGPTRATVYGGSDYVLHANQEVMTMAMIETAEAVENLEDILSVPGLNAIYIGPGDLSLSLFGPERSGIDLVFPEYMNILEQIVDACNKAGVVPGIHTNSVNYARHMIEKGFRFITTMTDTVMLRAMATQTINGLRDGKSDEQSNKPREAY